MSALGLVIVSGVLVGAGGPAVATAAAAPKGPPPVSISGPSVVPRPPGSWATFTLSLRQGGQGRPFHGELRLVPEDVIAAAPASDTPVTTSTLSPAAAATTTTTRPPPNPSEAVYKAPITLAAGVSQSVSFLVPVGGVSYRPELYDDDGRLVATGSSTKAAGAPVVAIGLLTDRPNGFSILQTMGLNVVRTFQGGSDFPEDATALAGLDVIDVDDFDSKGLRPRQRQALQDYVATGGSVVVAGGEAGPKTLAALPDALVPLKPTGVTAASLAPLFGLAGDDNGMTIPVITGELRAGRSVLGGPGGPPLVVEADHGWGRVVELSFDPLAVSDAMRSLPVGARPTRLLTTAPLASAFLRAAHTPTNPIDVGRTVQMTTPPASDPSPPVWSYLGVGASGRPPPSPALELVVLPLVLGLLVGAGVYVLVKGRNGASRFWAGVPVVALVVAVIVGGAPYIRHRQLLDDDVVRIDRIGGGSALSAEYHHLSAIRGGEVGLSIPAAGAWMGSAPPGHRTLPDAFTEVADRGPTHGPGSVDERGRIEVNVDAGARGDARRLRVLRGRSSSLALEAHLRLRAGKLVGTVTNRASEPLRELEAHLPGGTWAELAPAIGPGATITVEASVVPSPGAPSRDRLSQALDPTLGGFAAEMGSGRLALSALAPGGGNDLGPGVRRGSAIRVVAVPADIEGADSFDAGFGAPRLVCCGTASGVAVYDLRVPVGMSAPVSLSVPKLIKTLVLTAKQSPIPIPIPATEVYDWQTGAWRVLTNEGDRGPLTAGETAGGVVRVRVSPATPLIPAGELIAA